MTGKKRMPLFFFFMGAVLAGYLGYLVNAAYLPGSNIFIFFEQFNVVCTYPFENYWNITSIKGITLAIFVYMFVALIYITGQRNYITGKEHGTARFANPKHISKFFADKNDSKNRILSQNLRISINTRKTRINNNIFVIGGAGAGKSLFVCKCNLMQLSTSFVVTDPKGELLATSANYLKENGYTIRVLNLLEMDKSDCYNPFYYIREENDIIRFITNLIQNTTPKNSSSNDPFWEKAESLLLQSIFYYIWMECRKEEQNFTTVLQLLSEAEVNEDGSPSELDRRMERLRRKRGEEHPALRQYYKVTRGAADTVRSIVISANSRLAYLENPQIQRVLSRDDMNIKELGIGKDGDKKTKTALFCVIPDNNKSYNFVVGLLYSAIFQELYYQADFKYGGRLPIHVTFMLDEFANVALPDDFCSLLSTMRSREISCVIIIQNLAQIKALFKDTWETIPGNSDVLIYLGGNEQSTHKYISESLGKGTYDKKSSGETKGKQGSSSRNYDVLGRELLMADEVRKLDNKKCIVFVRGQDPVIDHKYNTFKHKLFRRSGDYSDEFRYVHERLKKPAITLLNSDSYKHYLAEKKSGANVIIHELSVDEILDIDLTKPLVGKILTDDEIQKKSGKRNNPEHTEQLEVANVIELEIAEELQEQTESNVNESNELKEQLLQHVLVQDYSTEQIEECKKALAEGVSISYILEYFNAAKSVEELKYIIKNYDNENKKEVAA